MMDAIEYANEMANMYMTGEYISDDRYTEIVEKVHLADNYEILSYDIVKRMSILVYIHSIYVKNISSLSAEISDNITTVSIPNRRTYTMYHDKEVYKIDIPMKNRSYTIRHARVTKVISDTKVTGGDMMEDIKSFNVSVKYFLLTCIKDFSGR